MFCSCSDSSLSLAGLGQTYAAVEFQGREMGTTIRAWQPILISYISAILQELTPGRPG